MTEEISLEEFRKDIRRQMRERGKEISLAEFREDIRRQRGEALEKRVRAKTELWKHHPEALTKPKYDKLTKFGCCWLTKPRPVWLQEKNKWTVGAPVDPIGWQILIADPVGERVTKRYVENVIMQTCDWFTISDTTFSNCISRLQDRRLLYSNGEFRRSRVVNKWLHPDLTGLRGGGEWHRKAVHDFIDTANREFGCYTYADRGFYVGFKMPDVVMIKPQLVKHTVGYHSYAEPLKWDLETPIYAEFKSSQDMRRHPARLKTQLRAYAGVPLYLEVEARVGVALDMLEDHGRRGVNLVELFREGGGDMVCLRGSERPETETSFNRILERVEKVMIAGYDIKARLKKTRTDEQGREHYSLVLYDKLGTPKTIGRVIPDYGVDIWEFVDLYFGVKNLGRITTANYTYTPNRKPTDKNKTWAWVKTKTAG